MNAPDSAATQDTPPQQVDWSVRLAKSQDIPGIVGALGALIAELGGSPPAMSDIEPAARILVEDEERGVILLAVAGEKPIGLVSASWPFSLRTTGSYALIEELWVDPARRGEAVGQALLSSLGDLVEARGMRQIEVGLPSPQFAALPATEAFYRANGFTALGPRMRRRLP